MKHLGDITMIDGSKIEPVDVITGGSPCQDLSVAGLRAGLDGERSGLFMEQIRIIKEMRANEISNGRSGRNVRPRYMVWENVCGAFSSNGGKDFQTVLTEIARIVEPEAPDVPLPERGGWSKSGCIYSPMGKWSIAWRLHDAQFWGVPQRRKRIALVADFGGLSAPEILFERKGVSGYTEPSEEQKQGTSGEIRSGSASADRERERERERRSCGVDIYNLKETEEVSATVTTSVGQSTASGGKVMQEQETFGMSPYHSNCMLSDNPHSGIYKADISRTIDLNGGNKTPLVVNDDVAETLDASYYKGAGLRNGKERQYVVEEGDDRTLGLDRASYNQGTNAQFGFSVEVEKIGAQTAKGPGAVCTAVDCRNSTEDSNINGSLQSSAARNNNSNNVCRTDSVVRRLTPLEAERLPGFPDGWTDIGDWKDEKGKTHKGDSDAPRYKALGNSIAVGFANNCSGFWMWLMKRISAQYERNATLGSLFDGISGFPLAWAKYNGPENCRWSSEIEEFPIAVCKKHFGDEDNGTEGDIKKYL